MHHLIYPSQDTFVASQYPNSNYGLNEVLKVGSDVVTVNTIYPTSDFTYTSQSVSNWCVTLFTGHIDSGSLTGTSSFISGSANYTSSAYTGSISQSVFSGSLTNFFGNVTDFSGEIFSGIVTGVNTVMIPREVITESIFSNYALVQFDISAISTSVASGDITNPQFILRMKVARAETLPIQYSLTAAPISESWVMGNGYFFDGGSATGASWLYRDFSSGSAWATPGVSTLSPTASENFNYEVGDIKMNVTNIVNGWISGAYPNYGLRIISSDPNTGMTLFFFSNDSNTIYRPTLDVGWGNDISFQTTTASTSSVDIVVRPPGLFGTVTTGSQVTGSSISGSFGGIGNLVITVNLSASGMVVGSGSLAGGSGSVSIYGDITGSLSQSIVIVYTPQTCPPNTFGTASVSQSLLTGTFIDGPFFGCTITALFDGYHLSEGSITGSWRTSGNLLDGAIISSSNLVLWPSIITARLDSPYLSGNMVGSVSNTDSMSYGIFQGTIIEDFTSQIASVYLPFSGSIFLVPTSYTSSVTIVSSSLDPIEFGQPFVAVIQNLHPTYRAGNIVRINVFGREEAPLKNFARSTQFSQFLTPKYLPVSSSYSIKDNQTEEIVLDFDNYTRLSCDINGNYFLLDTTGLPQERYFKILIKTEQSGSIYTMDNGNIFKIVR